jgi:hypothetical protein
MQQLSKIREVPRAGRRARLWNRTDKEGSNLMKTSLRVGNISGVLVALLCAGGLAACTTTEAEGGTGGSGGSGGGTTTPVGSGGTGAGGSTGAAGADGTLCPPPQQIITQFTYDPAAPGASTKEVRFGSAGTLQGGQNYYPTEAGTITSDVTQGSWHLSGTVGDYSGFALYFDACDRLDASQFQGIRFTISGSVPQGNAITMGVGTVANTPTGVWMKDPGGDTAALPTDAGRCIPTSGNQYYHPGCTDPTTAIAIPSTPTQTDVPWTKLTGGTPVSSPNPKEITSIYWYFPWSDGATPYQVDLVMDDLQFIL